MLGYCCNSSSIWRGGCQKDVSLQFCGTCSSGFAGENIESDEEDEADDVQIFDVYIDALLLFGYVDVEDASIIPYP